MLLISYLFQFQDIAQKRHPGSYLFSFPGLWPFWLPVRPNLGIFGSEQDDNRKLFLWKWNDLIYVSRAWFQGPSSLYLIEEKSRFLYVLYSYFIFRSPLKIG